MLNRNLLLGLMFLAIAGCVEVTIPERIRNATLPAMGWDARPEAAQWTRSTLGAVARYDTVLAGAVPDDIAAWCPAYGSASQMERRAFWVGLLSALARHESSWNPQASGGGGRYIGLTQISPRTAKAYGCEATSAAALKDGAANLSCAVKIMAQQVGQDGVVAGNGRRGLGRDWGPFKKAAKRDQMQSWTASQSYCS